MVRLESFVALSTAILLGLGHSNSVNAQEKKAETKDGVTISKSQKEAAVPDFAKALGLPFESVQSLSARLKDARRKSDPITLALLSTEVALAEKVSGKMADVTAEQLQKEAVELVKLRASHTELKAMAHLLKDKAAATELSKLAKEAEEQEKGRSKTAQNKDDKIDVTSRGIRYLQVTNRTTLWAAIRIDGFPVGAVPPLSNRAFDIPQHYHPRAISLSARDGLGLEWQATIVLGAQLRWNWVLEP